jgi:TfoX/Sxy family transcriptional regulator of competence genes
MAFDEALAQRVREAVRSRRGITERRMFGGIAFMSRGHMFVGVLGSSLMARVGPQNHEQALAKDGVREMDFTGKPMRGYVFVDAKDLRAAAELKYWVDLCADFVAGLPAKRGK